MHQVNWHEHFLERGHRSARRDVLFAEATQGRGTDLDQAIQLIDGGRAIVPKMRQRMSAAGRTSIRVGEISKTFRDVLLENGHESRGFVAAIGKILVTVKDSALIPLSDSRGIGVA